jgi:hypothetical protein
MLTTKKLTFEEFLAQYPDGYGIFELVNGEIVHVEATSTASRKSRIQKSKVKKLEIQGFWLF